MLGTKKQGEESTDNIYYATNYLRMLGKIYNVNYVYVCTYFPFLKIEEEPKKLKGKEITYRNRGDKNISLISLNMALLWNWFWNHIYNLHSYKTNKQKIWRQSLNIKSKMKQMTQTVYWNNGMIT